MEGLSIFIGIIIIVFGILQIVLFFKIWSMTSDVRRLADKLAPMENKSPEATTTQAENEDVGYTDSVWKCSKCNTINHYRKAGDSTCVSCGHIL